MGNLVVRGYDENGSYVTRGYGVQEGTIFQRALAGVISMAGSLATLFISGGPTSGQKQGGIRVDIDIGT